MTKIEVINFLEKLKVNYNELPIKEDYVFREWYSALKPYDAYDVFLKLDEHLNSNYKSMLPKPSFITKYLKTPEEKKKTAIDYLIRCNLCSQEMRLSEYDNKHFDRCSSINYLLRTMKNKGIKVKYEDLEQLDDIKFQKVYEKYKDY